MRTSKFPSTGCTLNHEINMDSGYLSCPSQKEILINLNGRLAAYLERVRTLEESNQQLQLKINKLSEKRVVGRDNSHYYKTIAELESQIQTAKVTNSELRLNVENTKITADGLKAKCETELTLSHTIATNVKRLKAISRDLEMEKHCLEVEVQILSDELQTLKRDHKEEKEFHLHEKSRGKVEVEVESPQTKDISEHLEKMREQYKQIADYYRRASEVWFNHKNFHLSHHKRLGSESTESNSGQLHMLRRAVRDLEVEAELLQCMKSVQEAALYDIESGYAAQIDSIQEAVLKVEEQLAKIRSDSDSMNADSRILYYLKDLLEMEVRTYGLLMDEEDSRMQDVICESSCGIPHNRQKAHSVTTKNPPIEDLTNGQKTHRSL